MFWECLSQTPKCHDSSWEDAKNTNSLIDQITLDTFSLLIHMKKEVAKQGSSHSFQLQVNLLNLQTPGPSIQDTPRREPDNVTHRSVTMDSNPICSIFNKPDWCFFCMLIHVSVFDWSTSWINLRFYVWKDLWYDSCIDSDFSTIPSKSPQGQSLTVQGSCLSPCKTLQLFLHCGRQDPCYWNGVSRGGLGVGVVNDCIQKRNRI